MRSSSKLHNLSKQCTPPTAYGLATKNALAQGKLPPKVYVWPDEPAARQVAGVRRQQGEKKEVSRKPRGIPYPGEPIIASPQVASEHGQSLRPLSAEAANPSSDGVTALHAPPLPFSIPIHPLQNNLQDLIDLDAVGERVCWPCGLNPHSAKRYVEDYEAALRIGHLYLPSYWAWQEHSQEVAPEESNQEERHTDGPSITISRRTAYNGINPKDITEDNP